MSPPKKPADRFDLALLFEKCQEEKLPVRMPHERDTHAEWRDLAGNAPPPAAAPSKDKR